MALFPGNGIRKWLLIEASAQGVIGEISTNLIQMNALI
jgi:hypothetical protein